MRDLERLNAVLSLVRLRCNDESRATLCDDIAELFKNQGRPVEIDGKDDLDRCLMWQDARPMDDAGTPPRLMAVSTRASTDSRDGNNVEAVCHLPEE